MPHSRRPDLAAAIASGLAGTADGPCVPWPGYIETSGYGRLSYLNTPGKPVHRAVWLMAGNEIPDGLTIDHTCHDPRTCPGGTSCPHRRCVNVAHLRLATLQEQMANSVKRGAETCANGHPWTEANTYTQRTGKRPGRRWCRECVRAARRKRK